LEASNLWAFEAGRNERGGDAKNKTGRGGWLQGERVFVPDGMKVAHDCFGLKGLFLGIVVAIIMTLPVLNL